MRPTLKNPLGPTARRPASAPPPPSSSTSTAKAAAPAAHTAPVSDEMLRDTHCPFIRTALKAGVLGFDGQTAPIDRLKEVLGPDFGRVPAFFARQNHKPEGGGWFFTRTTYDPIHLVGSKGDHPGDTGILSAAGFSEAAFRAVTSHSTDGKTMTADDFVRAFSAANAQDPGANHVVDRAKSAGEFALLLEAFGHIEGGKKRVSISDMRLLFEKNEFPPNWEQSLANASAVGWTKLTLQMSGKALFTHQDPGVLRTPQAQARALQSSMGGTGDAIDGVSYALDDGTRRLAPSVQNALAGTMNAVCPAQGGKAPDVTPTKAADVDALHAEVLSPG